MTPATIAMLSLSMSTDAFAASLAKGAALDRPLDRSRWGEALRTGIVFGIVEAITPLLGWAAGFAASAYIAAIDHWIAFILLGAIGGHMLLGALRAREEGIQAGGARPRRHGLGVLVATAIATSLDAMAVGVSLAMLDVNIAVVAGAIGMATFVMASAGMLVGRHVGGRFGRWAEGLGGLFLMGLGGWILIEHIFLG